MTMRQAIAPMMATMICAMRGIFGKKYQRPTAARQMITMVQTLILIVLWGGGASFCKQGVHSLFVGLIEGIRRFLPVRVDHGDNPSSRRLIAKEVHPENDAEPAGRIADVAFDRAEAKQPVIAHRSVKYPIVFHLFIFSIVGEGLSGFWEG